MKPPFFRLTSRCDSDRCHVDTFQTEVKRMTYASTSGQNLPRTRQVCRSCGALGHIIKVEEVA